MTNIQLATILSEYSKRIDGGKIDLLGLDACLMALAEICHELSPYVSLVVASDEAVPMGSWPYDSVLGDLNKFPGMDANALSAVIINRFLERYTKKANRTRVSLSSMNLAASSELVNAMKMLVNAMDTALEDHDTDGTIKRTIFRARDASRTPDEVTYIDFGVFCKELSESSFPTDPAVRDRAKDVHDLLLKSAYILYHRDAGEDGSIDPYGLAIYFPLTLDRPTSLSDTAFKQRCHAMT